MNLPDLQRPFADLVQIVSAAEDGADASFGCGLLVRKGVVLTALHCVGIGSQGSGWRGRTSIQVRLWRDLLSVDPPAVYVGRICWPELPGSAEDIAVLRLAGQDGVSVPAPVSPAEYCKLPNEGEDILAAARGFPAVAGANPAVTGNRAPVNLSGLASLYGSAPPTVRFKSTSDAAAAGTDAWKGLSGGPLLCGGAVAGVMREVPRGWDGKSVLDATPLSHLLSSEAGLSEQGQRLRELLGVIGDIRYAERENLASALDQDTRAKIDEIHASTMRLLAISQPGELFEDKPPLLASSINLQKLADILSDLATPNLDLRAERAAKYHDNYYQDPSQKLRIEADYAIYSLCKELYDETYEVGDGEWGYARNVTRETTLAPIVNSSLIPIDDSGSGDLWDYVSWSSLYSAMTVFVLPVAINSFDISYSGKMGSRTSYTVIERLLFLLKTHEDAVRAGRVVFLPRATKYTTTSTRDYSTRIYEAPFRQPAGELRFLPLNLVKALQGRDFYSDLGTIYTILSIPVFQKVRASEIIKIAESETDAFLKFNHFLNRKLRAVGAASTKQRLRECIEEIQYEVANLNIQAERIAKLKAFSDARKTTININIGSVRSDVSRDLAGAIASPEFADLIASASVSQGNFELKKNDLYFAFLLQDKKRPALLTEDTA
jgi:Trypsin